MTCFETGPKLKETGQEFFLKCLYFDRIFLDAKKLKTLRVNHNQLISLPPDVDTMYIEEILLHNNKLASLPPQLLNKANK